MTNKLNKQNIINIVAGLVYVIVVLQVQKPHSIKR